MKCNLPPEQANLWRQKDQWLLRSGGFGGDRVTADGYRASFWDDENMKLARGNCRITMNVRKPLNCIL